MYRRKRSCFLCAFSYSFSSISRLSLPLHQWLSCLPPPVTARNYLSTPSPHRFGRRQAAGLGQRKAKHWSVPEGLTRSKVLTRFAPDMSCMILATNPKFLAKNERLHHRMKPTKIPSLMREEEAHELCPVRALHDYITAVPTEESEQLWIWPDSQRICSSVHLASVICSVIKEADPESAPTAHEVRSYASSMAFARSLDPILVKEAGQWASCATFINRYLNIDTEEANCVAMGSVPM